MSPREAELTKQLEEKEQQLAQANRKIELLQQKIDLLVRRIFGSKGEKLDSAQLLLLLQGLDEPGKAPEPVAAEAHAELYPEAGPESHVQGPKSETKSVDSGR